MITGVILAGGENRRMGGRPKAFLTYKNQTFIERQINEMKRVCSEILIVTNTPTLFYEYEDSIVSVISDLMPGLGPLGGVYTSLRVCKYPIVWVVGCDMPFINSQVATLMMEFMDQADVVIPSLDDRKEPLHALYHKRCAPVAEILLNRGELKMGRFLSELSYFEIGDATLKRYGFTLDFVTNLNSPGDYERFNHS